MCERKECRKWSDWMKFTKSIIKPCLCGSAPSFLYERYGPYDDRMYFYILCEKCGIKMKGVPHSTFLPNEEIVKYGEELVEKWNTWISNETVGVKVDRVSDEWLEDMLRLYNAVCTSEGNLQMYRAFYELKQRREAEGPIDMAVVDDLFIDDVVSSPNGGEIMRRSYISTRQVFLELQARRKAEKDRTKTAQERGNEIDSFEDKIEVRYHPNPCRVIERRVVKCQR